MFRKLYRKKLQPESVNLLENKQLDQDQDIETTTLGKKVEQLAQISLALRNNVNSNLVQGFSELFRPMPSLIQEKMNKIEKLSNEIIQSLSSTVEAPNTGYGGIEAKDEDEQKLEQLEKTRQSIIDSTESIATVLNDLENKSKISSVHNNKALQEKIGDTAKKLEAVFMKLVEIVPLPREEKRYTN